MHLKDIEQHLQRAAELAAACGVSRTDLLNTLTLLTEEE